MCAPARDAKNVASDRDAGVGYKKEIVLRGNTGGRTPLGAAGGGGDGKFHL